MSSVFVSHASSDDALVGRTVGDLRTAGHGVWGEIMRAKGSRIGAPGSR